uniref:Cytochrome b561 bacterial/Ni-hydrogenase domain-containing protein n=1 Tax=Arcella intermedia TaxID=1963864 RepID=A0A6B2LKS5_9EUKA
MHWAMAGGVIGIIGTAKAAQNTKVDAEKAKYMWVHKSLGLMMAGLIVPRAVLRVMTRDPRPLPGPTVQHYAGALSHGVLYFLMAGLPLSGIVMGYFSGRGLPFFWTSIPGAAKPQGDIAKRAFFLHQKMGQALEIMTILHVSAAAIYHKLIMRHSIFKRIL